MFLLRILRRIMSNVDSISDDICPIASFSRSPSQSEESFQEQEMALNNVTLTIDNYLDALRQNTFVKCRVITGAPGSGKSFLLNYACIYAISKGLSVGITALMAQRVVHLGGSIYTSCSTSLRRHI